MTSDASASLRFQDDERLEHVSAVYDSTHRRVRKRPRRPTSLQQALIRAADIFISLSAIIFLLPAFLLISILIYLEDKGPVLFVQPRVGRKGVYFNCLKFRSMRIDGEAIFTAYLKANPQEAENWLVYRKLENDPRITSIGQFIRKTSLDEFPQLINVLKGEMSLVGPRPIVEAELKKYGSSIRMYKSVLPGITGLWQVKGRNSLTYRQRVALDRVFARKAGVFLYATILLLTIPAVLFQRGSR